MTGPNTKTNDVGFSTHGSVHGCKLKYCNLDCVDPVEVETANFVKSMMNDSPFFDIHPPKLLPMFDPKEVDVGTMLGEGEFGTVREVDRFHNTSESRSLDRFLRSHMLNNGEVGFERSKSGRISFQVDGDLSEFDPDGTENFDFDATDHSTGDHSRRSTGRLTTDQFSFARQSITARAIRHGRARYAVKRLREDLEGERGYCGSLDLAAEATFLAALEHPNIIKIRATIANPGDANFMMVLDRLYLTVEQQVEEWKLDAKGTHRFPNGRKSIPLPFFKKKFNNAQVATDSLISRIVVAYDVARALRYLHQNKIIYRDLKPANVGFDIRGDVRLFDFGLAKELREEDLVCAPDDYNVTGLTGSRRWMAPEVVRCLPYGTSCDVYSWGLFFWMLCSLKVPFGNINCDWHFKNVVEKNVRPKPLKNIPQKLQEIMKKCWSEDKSQRPTFDYLSRFLQTQLMVLRNQAVSDSGKYRHRSMFLRQKSRLSFRSLMAQAQAQAPARSETA